MVELPSYNEHKNQIENRNYKLMPEIETVHGEKGRLVEYNEEDSSILLEMDHRHLVKYDESDVKDEMDQVMDSLYETVKELED